MVKTIKVNGMKDVTALVRAASESFQDIGVHDAKGAIADAKSILGLMSLDYTNPVKLVCEDAHTLNTVAKALS